MTEPRNDDRVELRLTRSKAELRRMAEALDRFSQAQSLAPRIVNALGLALEEALTNVVFYAFEEPSTGGEDIHLIVERRGGSIRAVVRDRGRPFDPTAQEPSARPTSLDELEPGGLGIGIIRGMVDRLEYRREDGFNRLEMEIKL